MAGRGQDRSAHFDRGEPPVGRLRTGDGKRSFTEQQAENLGPVGHRVRVLDADLNGVADATFYFQGRVRDRRRGGVAARRQHRFTRLFIPAWNGSRWTITVPSLDSPTVYGSIYGGGQERRSTRPRMAPMTVACS
ncbi:MAG: hypothetical protein U1E76_24815 [Planctomycetota bacterium]